MQIKSVVITPDTVNTGEPVTIKALVLDNQGFITKEKLFLKTKDGKLFIVKDA